MNTFIAILKGNTIDISKIVDNNITTKREDDKLKHNIITILVSIKTLEFGTIEFII